ncbi:MAG: FIST N-terminal domain-containing protein [Gemmatimonadaceae bacterium]
MRSNYQVWTSQLGWRMADTSADITPNLIVAFGAGEALSSTSALHELRDANPDAFIVSVSSAGEIADDQVLDNSIVALRMQFERTGICAALVAFEYDETSDETARRLAQQIDKTDLAHVLVFSDGLNANGSALVTGLVQHLPANVSVTGGLAADGDRFERTCVGLGATVAPRQVVAIALYGKALRVGFGSVGGWQAFGPVRLITKSHNNVLFELDGEPALALYKRYLGDAANELPASALLFPLALIRDDGNEPLVRTILAVNESDNSMTFAGDVPDGARVQLMRASFDSLVDGAEQAALAARDQLGVDAVAVMLVSCVGRKLVLKQRVEDELVGVRRILGSKPVIAGFYSYGEITPLKRDGPCKLHNQTMTITAFAEC